MTMLTATCVGGKYDADTVSTYCMRIRKAAGPSRRDRCRAPAVAAEPRPVAAEPPGRSLPSHTPHPSTRPSLPTLGRHALPERSLAFQVHRGMTMRQDVVYGRRKLLLWLPMLQHLIAGGYAARRVLGFGQPHIGT